MEKKEEGDDEDIPDGVLEDLPGGVVGHGEEEGVGGAEEGGVEEEGVEEEPGGGEADGDGGEGEGGEGDAVVEDLGGDAGGGDVGEHAEAAAGVVVAQGPGEGQEVGHLPQVQQRGQQRSE